MAYIDNDTRIKLAIMYRKLIALPHSVDIGYSISTWRKSLGITQRELAKAIGSSTTTISTLERISEYFEDGPFYTSLLYNLYKVINYLGMDLDNPDSMLEPPKTVPPYFPRERVVFLILQKLPKLSINELYQILRLIGRMKNKGE